MSILGIDLGTTNSVVAVCEGGVPRVIPNAQGARLLPSVLHAAGDRLSLGDLAKGQKVTDPGNTLYSVKRILGKTFEQIQAYASELPFDLKSENGVLKLRLGNIWLTPIEASARVLSELKITAEENLKRSVTQAVITVPAYFNDHERQATRQAARLAGLEPIRIVNEPTAAALAYGWTLKKSGTIAVFDLGGGTFDLSILKLHDGIFEVLATRGDTLLGGDDLDLCIARRLAHEVDESFGSGTSQKLEIWAAILNQSEKAKIALSESDSTVVSIELSEIAFKRTVTRAEMESWFEPVLGRLPEPCLAALQDAGISTTDLDDVVMVGGPTRLDCVRKRAEQIFGKKPNCSLHPDEVVALGAAIQADILAGNRPDLLLLDVTPLSLGIETYGDLVSVLIPRNSKVPCTAREVFTTFVDHQTGVDIHVLQGERDQASANQSLARFKLTPIARMPAGIPRIEVSFSIDPDGILQVSAKDQKTGAEQSIEVRPSLGLKADALQSHLDQAAWQSQADEKHRALQEAIQSADPVLRATQKFIGLARDKMRSDEYQRIESSLQDLTQAITDKDIEKIRASHFVLTRVTEKLADLVVSDAANQNR